MGRAGSKAQTTGAHAAVLDTESRACVPSVDQHAPPFADRRTELDTVNVGEGNLGCLDKVEIIGPNVIGSNPLGVGIHVAAEPTAFG